MLRLAASVTALAVHIGLGLLVYQHGSLGVDRAAFDVLEPVRGQTALDIVRVLTDLGSFPVATLVIAIAAVSAARQQSARAVLGLVAGLVVLLVLVNVAKEIWDRPRPSGRFYEPGGLSFPSGHSAYATAWLAAAATTGRRALIGAASVVVLAVCASRLYLHVHYLTDVVGGVALGAAVFTLVKART
ncbi:MAG: phosphatase PAP2 family protein [Solirubrobacteraceae bacterium]